MSGHGRSKFIEQFIVDGRQIDCYGIVYPDTPAGEFEHYELFEDGFCIHEADAPFFDRPTLADVKTALERERSN
jgi:hypothetical protein